MPLRFFRESASFEWREPGRHPGVASLAAGARVWFGDAGEVTVTWAHRDRLLQADQLIDTGMGNIGPEPGVTYRLRIYSGSTLKRTYADIAGASRTYSTADETTDGGPFNLLRIILDCQRDGLYSSQAQDVTVGRG